MPSNTLKEKAHSEILCNLRFTSINQMHKKRETDGLTDGNRAPSDKYEQNSI